MLRRICFLYHLQRIEAPVARLHRMGFLWDKEEVIRREFDHIALSFILSGDGFVESRSGQRRELCGPKVLVNRPGDFRLYGPLERWSEFFLAYDANELPRLSQLISRDVPEDGILPLYNLERVKTLLAVIDQLSLTPLSQTVPDQLDRLAETLILTALCEGDDEATPLWESRIIQFAQYLEANFQHQIDFDRVASWLGISFAAIRKNWGRKFNSSPYQYLMELRLHHAESRLTESYLSIGDVALACGFDDQRYFSRFFRRMTGMTPSQYRAQLHQKE